MNIVYLGLFQTILNWVIEKILSPVFKFVANLLSTVFGWIFDTVLGPLLQSVLIPLAQVVINLVFEAFAEVFYRLFVAILRLVDYMQIAFDVLIGIRPVAYYPKAGVRVEEPLLDVLFYQNSISRVLGCVTFMALAIAFIFTIYATAKSVFDLDFEGRRPVGMVLRAFFRTAVSFLLVPIFVLFMVKLSGVILTGVNAALTQDTSCTIGNTIFLVSSLDACVDEKFNISYTGGDRVQNIGFEDEKRIAYANGAKTYENLDVVRKEFKFSRFDYVIGYGVSIFMMIILAICLIQFVQRIFEVMLLYLMSPMFVSVMPLDEGEKFGAWRELFVAKCFMGFGAAFGMRLYLMIVGIIMGSSIDFTNGGYISREMDYVLKLLIVMGGAFAIFKSSSMLTMLLSWRAADTEGTTAAIVGGSIYAHTVGSVSHSISSSVHRQIAEHKSGKGGGPRGGGSGNAFLGGQGRGPGGGIPGIQNGARPDGHSFISQRTASGHRTIGYQGSHVKAGVGPDGKYRLNEVNTRLMSVTRGPDNRIGSVRTPLGVINRGPGGRLGLGGMNMGVLKTTRGADGRQHLSKVNLGVLKARRGEEGTMRIRSVNMKAIRFNRLDDGRMHVSSALGQRVDHRMADSGVRTGGPETSPGKTGGPEVPVRAHKDAVPARSRQVIEPAQRQQGLLLPPARLQRRPMMHPVSARTQQQDAPAQTGRIPRYQGVHQTAVRRQRQQAIHQRQQAIHQARDRAQSLQETQRTLIRPESGPGARQTPERPLRARQSVSSGKYRLQNRGSRVRPHGQESVSSRPGLRPATGERGGNRPGRR